MSLVKVVARSSIRMPHASSMAIARWYSGPSTEKKLSPEEARKQAAQLALQSLKDFGSLLSSSSSDEATQPIDTKPIFEDPTLFGSLSLLHQGQVLKELQEKYDKKWEKLTLQDKMLGYYIAYGNWGCREKFVNWDTLEAPYDLPFTVPSQVKTSKPEKNTIIKKLEPVILAETEVRKDQFDFKRMDGATKFFIYMIAFIVLFGLYRDKKIGEEGKPVEIIIKDHYEIERQARIAREEEEKLQRKVDERIATQKQEEKANSQRKWYFLWLK
ncbi:Genetic interactor of prohibitin 7 mitochondrial [Spathaspora sp. JA1]|nr:Genetic interactor of prohibitin 7 mitochondrial [Spathaspora sp. JA1]